MIDLAVLLGLVKGKLVVWWHCDFDKYKLLMPIYNVFVRHTLNKADRILVSAQGNIDHSNLLCDFKEKCTVIPYCVDESYLESGKNIWRIRKMASSMISFIFCLWAEWCGTKDAMFCYGRLNR